VKYFYKDKPISEEAIRKLPFYERAKVQREIVAPDGTLDRIRPFRSEGPPLPDVESIKPTE
jgi:hypothetical protein